MTSPSMTALRLHFTSNSPVKGLAVAERRVASPEASIICVHGALDRGGSFSRLARRLETFDFVAYDRRGYQGSRGLAPLGLDRHIDDLCALVAHEASERPVILFGHSFGGVVTFGAALRDPSRVQLVVNYESPYPWLLRRQDTHPPLTEDTKYEAERFFRRVMSDKAWERLSELQRESRRLDGPALLSDLSTIRGNVAPYDLATLQIPATYAYGDAPGYYRDLGAEMEKVSSVITTAEIHHAGHAAHLKNPDQLAALVRERLAVACASV